MDYLPLFASVKGRAVLLVGGGEVALRKARLLLDAGARLTLVAPQLHPELAALAVDHRHHAAEFKPAHLDGQVLVIAATDDEAVNAAVARESEARGLWVNVITSYSIHYTKLYESSCRPADSNALKPLRKS